MNILQWIVLIFFVVLLLVLIRFAYLMFMGDIENSKYFFFKKLYYVIRPKEIKNMSTSEIKILILICKEKVHALDIAGVVISCFSIVIAWQSSRISDSISEFLSTLNKNGSVSDAYNEIQNSLNIANYSMNDVISSILIIVAVPAIWSVLVSHLEINLHRELLEREKSKNKSSNP